ncbi:MAG TPA: cache domain-containing protein [Accumulibacter sp.]|nr:cache domain-containing protein [Accumulibacter sp.]
MTTFFSTLPLRNKLLFGYLLTFLVSVVLGNLIILLVVHNTIETNTEKELINTNNIIMNMVKSASDASIKNHLRAVAEKNLEIVRHYHEEFRQGRISEQEAKNNASEVLLSQTIGKTGYIYGVDSKGILRVHPKINGSDLSKYDFIRQQIQLREGYLEYEWANPGEMTRRKKALYMSYFGPWDWIISVSSYRDEFKDLFKVSDFRDEILSISFGKTGYPYVMDGNGTLIIHPKRQGQTILDAKDSNNREFIKEIVAKKTGKIVYPWQNPGELEPRDKLVIFNYIPEFDWIVASSSYLEEFNDPLMTIGYVTLFTLGVVTLLVIPITWHLSSSINKPIQDIMRGFSLGAKGDYSSRIDATGADELGQLAAYFNNFMEKISESNRNLHASEEEYRLLFENAVEGVFTMTPHGKFLNVNPSMTRMLGYESPDSLLREIAEQGPGRYIDTTENERFLSALFRSGTVTGFETAYVRRDRSTLWVSVNARANTNAGGAIATITGFCSDVTAKKTADEA